MKRSRTLADERRIRGMHIGSGLRHLRKAAALNLDDAPEDQIRRATAKAVDSAGALVWRPGRRDE